MTGRERVRTTLGEDAAPGAVLPAVRPANPGDRPRYRSGHAAADPRWGEVTAVELSPELAAIARSHGSRSLAS
ncbi:hypothetical protein [Lentzea sp. E54]|uniref:hypothetical protein n=1 Tax=Lentzea xerophila TaxID=3435883 RepID=UPI003DA33A31